MQLADRAQAPAFVRNSPLLEAAYRLAAELHHGPRNRGDTEVEHPLEVATLLHDHGFAEQVVAAALLHDVIEDTAVDADEIAERFGPEIGLLVAEMTENERIADYRARKAEHRERVRRDGRVAAIYAADKVANARALRESDDDPPQHKLEHYLHTLVLLQREHPQLPFLAELQAELVTLGRQLAKAEE